MSAKYYDEFLFKLASIIIYVICLFFQIHCFVLMNLYYRITLINRRLCITCLSSKVNTFYHCTDAFAYTICRLFVCSSYKPKYRCLLCDKCFELYLVVKGCEGCESS